LIGIYPVIKEKEKENRFGQMDPITRDIGLLIKQMERED